MLPIWLLAAMMTGTSVFACLPEAHAYWTPKSFKQTVLHNRLNKENILVDVANLAPCCHDDYDVLLEVLGTLGKCYVSNPVAKTLAWIENHDWHNCFCMSSWGSPLLDPKKLQNEQILHNRLNMEKTPGRCCQSGYLLPWWLWRTIGGFGNPGQMLC